MPATTSGMTRQLLRQSPYWLNFVFAGRAFTAQYTVSIGTGATENIQLKTPIDPASGGWWVHLQTRKIIVEDEDIEYMLLENPTVTDGSTDINVSNLDRRSDRTNNFSLYSDPSNISGGTTIETGYIPGSTGVLGGPGVNVDFDEFERVLDADSDYILQITNLGDTSTTVHVRWVWYESEN